LKSVSNWEFFGFGLSYPLEDAGVAQLEHLDLDLNGQQWGALL
jgi:hypothetical protein